MTGFTGFSAPTSSSFGMNTQTTASPFGNDNNSNVSNLDIFFLCTYKSTVKYMLHMWCMFILLLIQCMI